MVFLFGLFSKMGSMLTKFRKKKTVIETLEDIDKQIKDFEKYKQKNEVNEKKIIGALILYSIVLYIFGAIFYYIYLLPKNLTDRLKTSIPFIISPILIYSMRRFLKWFFIKRTTYYATKLENLREEKKTILEDVKEKETYKKAREILERFGGGVEISITPPATPAVNKTMFAPTPFINNTLNTQKQVPGTTLVHRNVKHLQQQSQTGSQSQQQQQLNNTSKSVLNSTVNANLNATINKGSNNSLSSVSQSSSVSQQVPTQTLGPGQQIQQAPPTALAASTQARTLLPRPIITPNRTFFDRLLDFIIGEGPNNRYALICKNCHFHNGMALREEFEYVAFRCAYCLFYNEARKTKLSVPKFNNKPNEISNGKVNNINANESIGSSTLSSSNSFDEIDALTEPKSQNSAKSDVKSQGDSFNINAASQASKLENLKSNFAGDQDDKFEELDKGIDVTEDEKLN